MGTWSVEPTGNDEALEWIANAIEYPLSNAIELAITQLLSDPADDVIKAEAAVALLIDLTSAAYTPKYWGISVNFIALDKGLFELATSAIITLLSQEKWLAEFGNPHDKIVVLKRLLAELAVAETLAKNAAKR
jgi:hypothetical protein